LGAVAAATRQTQADRTARMREKLLDATVHCLAEKGYAATSTNDVVKRAGVSRGALAHHFSSKAELVAEAAAALIASRLRSTNEEDARARQAGEGLERRLRMTWESYERLFSANIEFMVAARTDAELRECFARAIGRYDFGELAAQAEDPWLSGDPAPTLTRYVMGCFIRGLCLERVVNDDALVEQIFEQFVALMKAAEASMRRERPPERQSELR
jgi:AcrR family transcriptional regulator